jgi:hypothetical protein
MNVCNTTVPVEFLIAVSGGLIYLIIRRKGTHSRPQSISIWLYSLSVLWVGSALHYFLTYWIFSRYRPFENALGYWGLTLAIWGLVGVAMANSSKVGIVRVVSPAISVVAWIVVVSAHPVLCSLITDDDWVRAIPSKGWVREVQEVDTAIILNFDFDRDKDGSMKSGAANDFLVQWTLSNTKVKLILAPDIVTRTVCGLPENSSSCFVSGVEIRKIPLNNEPMDEGILNTVFTALDEAVRLQKDKIILIAHDAQLQRASVVWEFARQMNKQKSKHDVMVVIPEMPKTPYPTHSGHLYSRSKYLHRIPEVFLFRMWDGLVLPYLQVRQHLSDKGLSH